MAAAVAGAREDSSEIRAVVADDPTDHGAVLLLDERLVVLAPRLAA